MQPHAECDGAAQDCSEYPILINATPEMLPKPLNDDEHFVDVPRVIPGVLSFVYASEHAQFRTSGITNDSFCR